MRCGICGMAIVDGVCMHEGQHHQSRMLGEERPMAFELTPPQEAAQGQADSDHYPTPPLLAREGLRAVVELLGHQPEFMVEPGCADRAPFLTAAANPDWEADCDTRLVGVEHRDVPRPEAVDVLGHWFPRTDYLTWTPKSRWAPDLIMTNPPFSLAVEFIERSRQLVDPYGLVVMLLQTGIEGSNDRREFWAKHRPILKLTPRPRPGFVKGGNDSREYAFYVFPGHGLGALLRNLGRDQWDSRFIDCPSSKGWGRAEQ